ncbi:MAG: NADH-quinone oxidoreductase subunit M [Deltaproteobacteria bacterium]|nr:NADH-quinone oxidoreductase subunit M [Deltaproteobacteria bacterium]
MSILSLQIFFPMLCGALVLFLPKINNKTLWAIALLVQFISFLMGLFLCMHFDVLLPTIFQWEERFLWVGSYGLFYHIGVDGVGLAMVLLTSLLSMIIVFLCKDRIEKGGKSLVFAIMLLQTSLLGIFCAIDLFLFFIFWLLSLVAMFFVMVFDVQRNTMKEAKVFFVQGFASSLLLGICFLSLLVMYKQEHGSLSTSLVDLAEMKIPITKQKWMFAALLVAFFVRMPLVPLHTWFLSLLSRSSMIGRVFLLALFITTGTFGLVRIALPLFTDAMLVFAPTVLTIAVINMVYGALLAWRQKSLINWLGYLTLSYTGFVVVGLFSFHEIAITGAIFQWISYSMAIAILIFVSDATDQGPEEIHMSSYAGMARLFPAYTFICVFSLFAILGLPGLSGFVGQLLIFIGTYQSGVYDLPAFLLFGMALTLLLTFVSIFNVLEIIFFGGNRVLQQHPMRINQMTKLIPMITLLLCIFYLGVQPSALLSLLKVHRLEPKVSQIEAIHD